MLFLDSIASPVPVPNDDLTWIYLISILLVVTAVVLIIRWRKIKKDTDSSDADTTES